MRRFSEILAFVFLAMLSVPLFAQQNAPKHAAAFATAPDIAFDSAGNNYLKLPAGLYLGEAMAVARNSKGQIFVFTRSGEASRLFHV